MFDHDDDDLEREPPEVDDRSIDWSRAPEGTRRQRNKKQPRKEVS